MRHTWKQHEALKGIGQHYEDSRPTLTVDDVAAVVCLLGMIVWMIWLVWYAVEG